MSVRHSLEESLRLWSQLLIEHKLLVDVGLLVLGVHLSTLVHEQDILDLSWIKDDLAPELVCISRVALEEHDRGPVCGG